MKLQLQALLSLCCLPLAAQATSFQSPAEAVVAPALGSVAQPSEARIARTLLVSWRADALETQKLAARSLTRAVSTRDLSTPAMQIFGHGGLEAFELPLGVDLELAAAELRRLPGVRAVDIEQVVRRASVSNDPAVVGGQTWGLYGDLSMPANQYGSQAAEAWARGLTGSPTVHVGVIDEGVDINHPDLAPNIWRNPNEPIDGVDNDGNGKIDDQYGWDFYNNDRTVYDGTPSDIFRDEHGTHVAGIIGARGGNGIGGAGVAWSVKMITAKVLDYGNGSVASLVLALDYMTDLKSRRGINIGVVNMSVGFGSYSQAVYDALERARLADIVVVVAAGNGGLDYVGDNNDTTPYYPASYNHSHIISVANITSSGALSWRSNYGPISVDIGAPGESIRSTLPQNRYGLYSGTSMAAPFVTGAVAVWRASRPTHSAPTTRGFILLHRTATPSLSGKVYMNGRLNMSNF